MSSRLVTKKDVIEMMAEVFTGADEVTTALVIKTVNAVMDYQSFVRSAHAKAVMEVALARGSTFSNGHPVVVWDSVKLAAAKEMYVSREHSISTIMEAVGVSRSALYRALQTEITAEQNAGTKLRRRGKGGRPTSWTPERLLIAKTLYEIGEYNISAVAQVLGVSRATVYRGLNLYKQDHPPANVASALARVGCGRKPTARTPENIAAANIMHASGKHNFSSIARALKISRGSVYRILT